VGDDQRSPAVQLQAHILQPFLAVTVLVLTAALPLAVEYVVDRADVTLVQLQIYAKDYSYLSANSSPQWALIHKSCM
jgi:hypothetical protein